MAPTVDYLSSGEGVFKGPSVIMGPSDSYAIVLGNDNTYKVVRLSYGGAAQTEALKLDATAAATFAGPLTVLSGGAVNLNGPVNVTTSGVTIVAGGLTVSAGGATLTGGLVIDSGAGTPTPATTSGTAIPSAAGVITVGSLVRRVTNSTTACTSVAITTGTVDGQMLIVINNGNTPVAFATQATSRIAIAATTNLLINQQQAKLFVWSATDTLWYPCGASSI